MTRGNAWRPVWELLGFGVPLLVLLGIGVLGLQRERVAAQAEYEKQSHWLSETTARKAEALLKNQQSDWAWAEVRVGDDGSVSGQGWFPHAPVPEAESTANRLMAEGRYKDVIDRFSGAPSAIGLPLGPIAAYRELMAAPDTGVALDSFRQLREMAFAYPSLITPQLLESAEEELQRMGITDPTAEPWRERWESLERLTETFNAIFEDPLPPIGNHVRHINGTEWWLEVGSTGGTTFIRLVPLDQWMVEVEREWANLPFPVGSRLAIASDERDLLPQSPDTDGWPRIRTSIGDGFIQIEAIYDPGVVMKRSRNRVFTLGGIGLVACAVVAAAWWRQQRILCIERELALQKDDFVSTVSHELRTPIASIQLLCENLSARTVTGVEAMGNYHQKILGESRRLSATTEQLLDFSLMERGHKIYRFSIIQLSRLADEVKSALEPLADACDIEIRLTVEPVSSTILGDAVAIRRLILNLGNNAIKFSPTNTRVEIHLGPESDGMWLIRVSDQGPGIPENEQPKIFDRFFRGGQVLSRRTRGTGIGLAVASHIADGHGGTLELTHSSADGCVFTCLLPCRPKSSNEDHESSAD